MILWPVCLVLSRKLSKSRKCRAVVEGVGADVVGAFGVAFCCAKRPARIMPGSPCNVSDCAVLGPLPSILQVPAAPTHAANDPEQMFPEASEMSLIVGLLLLIPNTHVLSHCLNN